METSWDRNLGSALVELAPVTNARNWASRLVARLFIEFISRWVRKALFTTELGCCLLNPLPGPENVMVGSSGAICRAVSPLLPLACGINWAWLWCLWQTRWTTRNNLLFTQVTALLTAMLGLLGNDPLARLSTLWVVHRAIGILALLRASTPLTPSAFAIDGTINQKARVGVFCTILVWAFLSAMLCWCGDLVHFCCRAIAAPSGACTRFFPIPHTINWAWPFATWLGLLSTIRSLTAFTATHLLLRDRKGLCLQATTTTDFFCFPIAAIHL
jgi:hypothetical protein